MPVMDGYELAQRIRVFQPALPVIGLTAHAMPEERQRCLSSGMVAHVSKPIDCSALVASILEHVARAPALPASMLLSDPVLPSHSGLIDWTALSDRYRGRGEFAEKLLAILVRTHAETPLKLRNAARAYDIETIKSLAHTLQGIAGNVEAVALHALAIQAEQSIREGRDDSLALAEQLAASMDELLDMLKSRS